MIAMAQRHKLTLRPLPFCQIKNGKKIYELRLYDERRRMIRPFDILEFRNTETNEILVVKVISLHIFHSFDELFQYFPHVTLGYEPNEVATPKDMEQYYSKAQQEAHHVVAIKIALMTSE